MYQQTRIRCIIAPLQTVVWFILSQKRGGVFCAFTVVYWPAPTVTNPSTVALPVNKMNLLVLLMKDWLHGCREIQRTGSFVRSVALQSRRMEDVLTWPVKVASHIFVGTALPFLAALESATVIFLRPMGDSCKHYCKTIIQHEYRCMHSCTSMLQCVVIIYRSVVCNII